MFEWQWKSAVTGDYWILPPSLSFTTLTISITNSPTQSNKEPPLCVFSLSVQLTVNSREARITQTDTRRLNVPNMLMWWELHLQNMWFFSFFFFFLRLPGRLCECLCILMENENQRCTYKWRQGSENAMRSLMKFLASNIHGFNHPSDNKPTSAVMKRSAFPLHFCHSSFPA